MTRQATFPKDTPRRKNALLMAKRRGEASEKWHNDGNKITIETMPEFQRLMKETDSLTRLEINQVR